MCQQVQAWLGLAFLLALVSSFSLFIGILASAYCFIGTTANPCPFHHFSSMPLWSILERHTRRWNHAIIVVEIYAKFLAVG